MANTVCDAGNTRLLLLKKTISIVCRSRNWQSHVNCTAADLSATQEPRIASIPAPQKVRGSTAARVPGRPPWHPGRSPVPRDRIGEHTETARQPELKSDDADVLGLRALLALRDVELDPLVLLQRPEATGLDGGEV